MKYFNLMFDFKKYDDATCLISKDMQGINQYIFDEGKKIEKWLNFTFYYNPDEANKFIDYQGNDLHWFIISSGFKKLIEQLGNEGVQFLPITIINKKNNSVNKDYFAVNVYNQIENAMDYDKTGYMGSRPSDIDLKNNPLNVYVRKYALRENKIKRYHIFRIKEKWTTPIFVSEKFVEMVKKNKITGCDFGNVIVS